MEQKQAFKILIAYETLDSAIHATELSQRMLLETESECVGWPFELLAADRVRERAMSLAAAADVIIIAARGAAELPHPVKDWIETGLRQKAENRVALVVLLDDDWTTSEAPPPLYASLRQIAERSRADLFCSLRPWEPEAVEREFQPPKPESRIREQLVPRHCGAREWGIND